MSAVFSEWKPETDDVKAVMLPRGGCVMEQTLAVSLANKLNKSLIEGDGSLSEEVLRGIYSSASVYGVPAVISYDKLGSMIKAWITYCGRMRAAFRLSNMMDNQEFQSDHGSDNESEIYGPASQDEQSNAQSTSNVRPKRSCGPPDRFKPMN